MLFQMPTNYRIEPIKACFTIRTMTLKSILIIHVIKSKDTISMCKMMKRHMPIKLNTDFEIMVKECMFFQHSLLLCYLNEGCALIVKKSLKLRYSLNLKDALTLILIS